MLLLIGLCGYLLLQDFMSYEANFGFKITLNLKLELKLSNRSVHLDPNLRNIKSYKLLTSSNERILCFFMHDFPKFLFLRILL